MSKLHQAISYINYWLNVVDRHSLQAPYIYNLYNDVIRNKAAHADFGLIERIRGRLKESDDIIPVVDYGAGSHVTKKAERAVRDIASKGVTEKKYSWLIYCLGEYIQAKNSVELGTSLGINTLYMSLNKEVKVTTFEGSPSLCHLARQMFSDMNKTNIQLVEGNIDETLPAFIKTSPPIDLAFIDANHRYVPTVDYFNLLLRRVHPRSCFIFDDIHWSKEMENAWEEIRHHRRVTLSIDIYQMGLVFFNPDLHKQHYVLSA